MIKALIDAGEALPDWLLQSEGEPPDDIYATEGTSKRYPEGWAEEFMSDEAKKEYRAKKAKKKKPVKKAKGGWIQGAIKKPGALRKQLGVKQGEKIPKAKLDKAAKAPGKLGQRARLAKTLRGFRNGGMVTKWESKWS